MNEGDRNGKEEMIEGRLWKNILLSLNMGSSFIGILLLSCSSSSSSSNKAESNTCFILPISFLIISLDTKLLFVFVLSILRF